MRVLPVSEARKRLGNISRQAVHQLIKLNHLSVATPEDIEAAGIDLAYVPPNRVLVTEKSVEDYIAYKAAVNGKRIPRRKKAEENDGPSEGEENT